MDKLIIKGPSHLHGEVQISRAKNAYLPILAGVILSSEEVILEDMPALRDIRTMKKLLNNLGIQTREEGNLTYFSPQNLNSHEATYDLVKTMRASIFVLGPLLAKLGKAKVSLPGGCAIGTRPIDIHLDNLKKLGATINLEAGYVEALAPNGLTGTKLALSFPSVGATENVMMAAVFAKGKTIIENAAKEPEIDDLAHFLNSMGAKVSGIGTSRIEVIGVEKLGATKYRAIGDRIEAGTYIMAGLATQSEIKVSGFNPNHLDFVINLLKEMGANLEVTNDSVIVKKSQLTPKNVDTAPYPGFPTDLQAQMMTLLTSVGGSSVITENIFENRFMHVPELQRLGANIILKGKSAFVTGPTKLKAAPVMCTDLRASAALVMAALTSTGECEISRVYHLDRGYEKLEEKLKGMGATVTRVSDS